MDPADFTIRHLTTPEEFQQCVEIQGAVWGYEDNDIVPRRMFLLAQKIGGQVLGAFVPVAQPAPATPTGPAAPTAPTAPTALAGFAMALPAYREGEVYLHSHMLAVLPEFRNASIGRRLKLAQRDDALARGIERMEWTYDPLEIKNAYLNISRLGAISRRYEADFYGPSSSPLQGGLPTDRLYAEWWLRSPRVEAILRGEPVTATIVERVLVPQAIAEWKRTSHLRHHARALQTANRIALQAAFERKLAAVGYERDAEGNGIFLLAEVDAASIRVK